MALYDTKHRIILDKPEDWDGWISFIKSAVHDPHIWNLIDPELAKKPDTTLYPKELVPPKFDNHGNINVADLAQYKALRLFRESELAKYEKEQKALAAVNKLIFETTSARMVNQVAYSDPDPWSKLVALKQRLKPSSQSRTLLVEKRYHQLAKGPINQDVDVWLTEWSDMFHEATRMNLPEVSGDRSIRDFLLAIGIADPIYSNSRRELRNAIDDQNYELAQGARIRQRTMDEEIERFRNQIRLQHTMSAVKDTRSAFATDAGKPTLKGEYQKGKKDKDKDKDKGKTTEKPPRCLCGEKMWYADCPYLVSSKAPAGWREDPAIRKKVDDALKDIKVQERVRKHIDSHAKQISGNTLSADSSSVNPEVFTTTLHTTLTAYGPGIGSFLIHNGGSSVHVCNGRSAHLYTKIRDAREDEYLRSGTGTVKIESWGYMETAFESPNGLAPIRLENVAFVESFVTSLVSQSILDHKEVYLDTGGPRLYKDGITKFLLYSNGGHYTFTATGIPHDYPKNTNKVLATTVNTVKDTVSKEH